jgi:hypothetical protein
MVSGFLVLISGFLGFLWGFLVFLDFPSGPSGVFRTHIRRPYAYPR